MSATSAYLQAMREKQDIAGHAREVLRILLRARGAAVTHRLIAWHVWERWGHPVPIGIHVYVAHIRSITGLGVRHFIPQRSYALWPELNQSWCRPEVWEAVGA